MTAELDPQRPPPPQRSWLDVRLRQARNPPPPVLRAVLANLAVAAVGGVIVLVYDTLISRGVALPGGDFTAYVLRSVASSGWKVHARLRVDAPAEAVLDRINPTVGVVESVDDRTSVLVTGADSLDTIAAYIGMLGMPFTVESPAELRPLLARLADVYARAAGAPQQS